jgi:hypothetical protein
VGGAVTADHGDGFVDLGSLGVVEAGDVAFDHGDEVPDLGDFLLGGGGVGACPLVDAVDGGGQPFPGPQQVLEIGLQVGQERDIGLEVVAAGTAVPDRAGAAAGLDVGGLAAGAVWHGDLPDRVPGSFGVQQGPGVTPDAAAVPVEAERGHLGRTAPDPGAGSPAPIRKPESRDLLDWEKEFNTQVNKIRYMIEQVIANFKTWRITHTDYRRPLDTFDTTISAVVGLHFYRMA